MESIFEFFNQIIDFITTGIYDFFVAVLALIVEFSVYLYLKIKSFALNVSWDVAKTILVDLNVGTQINSALGRLNPETQGMLSYFQVPQGLGLILQSATTKFVLNFFGFGK